MNYLSNHAWGMGGGGSLALSGVRLSESDNESNPSSTTRGGVSPRVQTSNAIPKIQPDITATTINSTTGTVTITNASNAQAGTVTITNASNAQAGKPPPVQSSQYSGDSVVSNQFSTHFEDGDRDASDSSAIMSSINEPASNAIHTMNLTKPSLEERYRQLEAQHNELEALHRIRSETEASERRIAHMVRKMKPVTSRSLSMSLENIARELENPDQMAEIGVPPPEEILRCLRDNEGFLLPDVTPMSSILRVIAFENGWSEQEFVEDLAAVAKFRIRNAEVARALSERGWNDIKELQPITKDQIRKAVGWLGN